MATRSQSVNAFISGTHNLLDEELVPKDAATDSLNWITKDGRIELVYGRQLVGAEGLTGKSYGEHTAYKVDGTEVRFRKAGTKVQYLNGTTWTDCITGLTASDVTFSNYTSLAGAFVFITSPDDGIYKIVTANPTDEINLYDSTKNFKGYSIIDKGRMLMWNTPTDKTGLYGSYIDAQNSTVYTTVTGEALADVATGTLAFKAGNAKRNCFGVTITDTSSGEVFTDNYNGVLTGSLGSTGTINYATGAFTISGQSGAGTASYQHENSTLKGVADFTKSSTRLAGEGFIIRQDQGGDAIKSVVPFDGSYFSMKERSVYQFTLDDTDLAPTNDLIRTDIGVSSLRSAIATSKGVVFLNTGNPSNPEISIVERNPFGDNFISNTLFNHYAFKEFSYDDAALVSWDRYIVVACSTSTELENDRILFCDVVNKSVDATYYSARTFAKSGGLLHAGDPVSLTTYELFSGFDDVEKQIINHWNSASTTYGTNELKKVKKLRFRGKIDPNQSVAVYMSYDNTEWQQIGTIRGDADYVDYSSSSAIGTTMVGEDSIGGAPETTVYDYFCELKLRMPKFRKRSLRFIAEGFGYVSIQEITDFDIWVFEGRLPKQYRSKQNVSIDGTEFDT
jgi:hypothetical protein